MVYNSHWVVCQLGARESYSIARSLSSTGAQVSLITDFWQEPSTFQNWIPSRISGRYVPELNANDVRSFNFSSLVFDLSRRVRRLSTWQANEERNRFFMSKFRRAFSQIADEADEVGTVFSYSYTAREVFQEAKRRGWRTVLGQIDPGLYEARLIKKLYPSMMQESRYSEPSCHYWQNWLDELDLADVVVVNSEWSRDGLNAVGVNMSKVRVIPLAYESSRRNVASEIPPRVSADDHLIVLFLGQINHRKGVIPLLEAARSLEGKPVELWMVGALHMDLPERLKSLPNVKYFGAVTRDRVGDFYAQADVFILPTHSDGFGLTQLEALAHGVPIIASRNCGRVVEDGFNGLALEKVTAGEIERCILAFLENSRLVSRFKSSCFLSEDYSLIALGRNLTLL